MRISVLGAVRALGTAGLLLLGRSSAAQTTGDLAGRVLDTSGAPLPGVVVEATSPSCQGPRLATTRGDGAFWIPAVPPGAYRLRAKLDGFRPAAKEATVSLDATSALDFALEVAREETVLVTGEPPLVDTSSTTTGTNYTSKVVARLPVGRNYADIVRANPGVATDRGYTQGRSLSLSIYGATSAENQWVIDGINTTNVVYGIQGKAINNEFVEEVEVKTGGYQPEFGRALGGVVNVITKSGGNELHGEAFAYYDSLATAAALRVTSEDEVQLATRLTAYTRTDVGADLGGFVLKDRLWFFAAYDRVQTPGKVSRVASSALVPSSFEFPLDAKDELYSGKLTWNAAEGTSVVATAFSDPTTNSGAGGADPRQGRFFVRQLLNTDPATWQADRRVGGFDFGFRLTRVQGSSALATLQASRHQEKYELVPVDAGRGVRLVDSTCQGGTPDAPCEAMDNYIVGGFGGIGGVYNHNSSHRDQVRADLTLSLGSHEVKAGADYQNASTAVLSSYSGGQLVHRKNERGQTYYVHNFIAVSPTDLTPTDVFAEPRTREVGAYLQDSWRPAPGVTVNAGLRWDRDQVRDYKGDTVLQTTAVQPRLGVVWDPSGNGSTKLYAFAGRFSYSMPTDLVIRSFGLETDVTTFNFDPVSVVQDPNVLKHGKAFINGGAYGDPVDPNLKATSQDELTLGVEEALSASFSIGLKATYRRLANAIEDRCDLDGSREETNYSYCGLMNPGSGERIARGDLPGCNGLDDDFYNCSDTVDPIGPARRVYRGIELLARKSFSEKMWLQASYVFSSLRGNYDGEVNASGQTDPGITADFDYPQLEHNNYGRLYLDRPHSFRLDGFYTAPFKLSVGLSAYVRSGAPIEKRGYFNGGTGGGYEIQLVPKGYEGREPTNWDANLTLAYPLTIGPATVTLQAFVYNLFNNQYATAQDVIWTKDQPPDYPNSLYDASQPSNNPNYGKLYSRQDPRLFRAAVRVSF